MPHECRRISCAMASIAGRCSSAQCGRAQAGTSRPARSLRCAVKASAWREVDRSTPLLIQANGQPIMAPRTESGGDPYSALLRQRTIFMSGEVEDFGADAIVSQLLLLDAQEQGKDIRLFINSPGKAHAHAHALWCALCPHALCVSWIFAYLTCSCMHTAHAHAKAVACEPIMLV